MKCEECQTLIEEFADGALDQMTAAAVTAHVNLCAECARFREGLVREQALYSKYDRDLTLSPALWSSIEARIEENRTTGSAGLLSRLREWMGGVLAAPRLSPAVAAVLVLFAVGLTVAVMTYLNSSGRNSPVATVDKAASVEGAGAPNNDSREPASAATSPGGGATRDGAADGKPGQMRVSAAVPRRDFASRTTTPEQLVRQAEQKYVTAIAMLSRDVNRRRSQLDPMLVARLDAALGDIDRTIRDTRRVVRENPEDPIALQYLLAAYSKKVDVLREITVSTD